MRNRVWLIGLAVIAATSGCGPESEPESAPEPVHRVQQIDPAKATVLTMGDTLEVVADLPRRFGDAEVLFSGFAGSDVLVGDVAPLREDRPKIVGYPVVTQEQPVMYDLDAKTFTILDDRDRAEPTQVVDISGTETTVVWAELEGTAVDHSDFSFHAYDRRTKKVTEIGRFTDPVGLIVYGNDLAIVGDVAYFSTAAYPKKRGQEAVYMVPVDGSKPPSVIAAGGVHLKISGDTLGYEVPNPHDKEAYPSIFTYDLLTGTTTPVPVSAHVDDAGFCGAELTATWETWCVGRVLSDEDPQQARLTIRETSGRTTEFMPFPVGSLNAPIPRDIMTLGSWTAITVTTDDGQDREFLVDLDTKDVKVFPDNTSFGALSPDRSTVLVSSFGGKGPGPQRLVKIPTS